MSARFSAFLAILLLAFSRDASAAPASAPVISVNGTAATTSPVTVGEPVTITMSTAFQNGAIFYTLDGSAPTGGSTRYAGSFVISSTKTIRALAYSLDFTQSAEADALEVRIVPSFTLTLINPAGQIAASPAPQNGKYLEGTAVRLTASGLGAWTFMQWENDATGTQNPIEVTMDRNKTVRAVFGAPINVLDPANGSIHTAPNIQPGVVYRNYMDVTVTAVPDPGYYFVTWGGVLSGTASPTTYFHGTANATISALFAALPANKETITATADHGGAAVVIDYRKNGPAQNYYDRNAMVSVYARPTAPFAFMGWTGDVTSMENPITLRLDVSKRIHATFQAGSSLTINTTDGGSVSRSAEGPVYEAGAQVQLTAVAQPGFTFAGWSGALSGAANPATVTVSGQTVVSARFAAAAWSPLWTQPVGGSVLLASNGGQVYAGLLKSFTRAGELRWERTPAIPYSDTFIWSANFELAIDPSGNARILYFSEDAFNDQRLAGLITYTANGDAGPSLSYGRGLISRDLSIGADGTLFALHGVRGRLGAVGDRITAHTAAGAAKWTFDVRMSPDGAFDEYFAALWRPAIDLTGNSYFAAAFSENKIYARTPDDAAKFTLTIDMGNRNVGREPGVIDYKNGNYRVSPDVVLGETGGYVIDGDGSLLHFNFDGQVVWRFKTYDVLSTPSIGADGAVFVGSLSTGNFYAVNADGTQRWVSKPGLGPYKAPAISSTGAVYVADSAGLYELNAAGAKVREFAVANAGSPILEEGRLYIGSGGETFAFEIGGTFANSPWPMFDANARQTAAQRAVLASPTIAEVAMAADGFHFVVNGRPGATIRVYRSEDGVNWTLYRTETMASGQVSIAYSPATGSQLFTASQE